MEQLLNQLPQNNLRHISWRGIALIVIAVASVIVFLIYSGGFNAVARIFGSKAGTESTFVLAGLANLSNSQDGATWLIKDAPSGLDGTGVFTSFGHTPSYVVPDTLDSAFVMPLVTSLDADTFTTHIFTSAPINIGQTGVPVNDISIYAYLPETSNVIFGYRTSDDLAMLNKSELHELTPTFATLPENADISQATISVNREMKQYIEMTADFHQFDSRNRPVVYGWVISYGQTITAQSAADTALSDNTKLTLTYSGGPMIPTDARIELLGSDLALNPIYGQDHINFQVGGGEYIINALPLPAGAYTIRVTGPTIKEMLVPFMVEAGDTELTVNLESFETGSGTSGVITGDLNGDGKVNSLDAQLLFEQYGQTP